MEEILTLKIFFLSLFCSLQIFQMPPLYSPISTHKGAAIQRGIQKRKLKGILFLFKTEGKKWALHFINNYKYRVIGKKKNLPNK